MIAPFLTALVLTVVHAAAGIVSTRGVTLQLVVAAVVLANRYGHPTFAWRLAILSGLGFDLLSGAPFGLFILLFFLTAWLVEIGMSRAERWGLPLTTAALTALPTLAVVAATGGLTAALLSAGITVGFTLLVAQALDRRLSPTSFST